MTVPCPKCASTDTTTQYSAPLSYFCRKCAHEWAGKATIETMTSEQWVDRRMAELIRGAVAPMSAEEREEARATLWEAAKRLGG